MGISGPYGPSVWALTVTSGAGGSVLVRYRRRGCCAAAAAPVIPECVEIAIAPAATVHVRDSKDTQRAQLAFTGASWTEFVSSVRR
jgi:hypothetical protein